MNPQVEHDAVVNATQLYEHYSVDFTPFWQTWPFYGVVAVILLCVVGYLGHILWLKIKNKKRILHPEEYALEELEGLRKSVALGAPIKDAYYALTSIIKRYLQERYGVHLEEKTDTEMISWLASATMLSLDIKDQLSDFFAHAYEIKFTDGYESGFDDQVARLKHIIEQTNQKKDS